MKQSLNFLKLFFLTLCIFYSTTILAQTYPEGMISYWKFDEGGGSTALDVVGDNNGTLQNGPQWISGKVCGALSFDRVDDYVRLPDVFPTGNSPRTIEAWFKLDWLTGRSMQTIAGWGTLSDGRMSFLDVYENIGGSLSHGIFFFGARGDYDLRGTTELVIDVWYHATVTYDGWTLKLYLNGNLESSKSVFLNTGNEFSAIGKTQQTSVLDGFNGTIDEVAIYNRALTFEEISKHYQNGLNGLGYEESISVSIDIKPGSVPNSINPNSKGVIPVAIISTEDFDATTINIGSVNFSSGNAIPAHDGHFEDVDEDGDLDLLLHFPTQDVELTTDDIELCLTGQLLNGVHFNGCDQITIQGKLNKDLTLSITEVARNYYMIQNYPNPFNPSTNISYSIPQNDFVSIKVFDSIGKEIITLVQTHQSAGYYSLEFDGSNLPSGIYYYTLATNKFKKTQKMLLMK